MDLEESESISGSNCLYDYIMLYDDEDVIGTFCGQQSIYITATTSTIFT